jgi:hypothetical protein
VATSTPAASTTEQNITATCPAGKTAIGGAAQVTPATLPVALVASQLVGTNQWIARAREMAATSSTWQVAATVICATVAP